jgi:hypothetical protein
MNNHQQVITLEMLRPIISLLGRLAFPNDQLVKLIAKGRGSEKLIQAYNLCNGQNDQTSICKKLNLNPGNFNRTVSRWEKAGIVFRFGPRKGQKLLHLYPINLQKGE